MNEASAGQILPVSERRKLKIKSDSILISVLNNHVLNLGFQPSLKIVWASHNNNCGCMIPGSHSWIHHRGRLALLNVEISTEVHLVSRLLKPPPKFSSAADRTEYCTLLILSTPLKTPSIVDF